MPALKLHTDLPPDEQSKAAPFHDLCPLRLALTAPSGPLPLVCMKGLLNAYNRAQTHERGAAPALFLTDNFVAILIIFLWARIGKWLVHHQAYWLGLEVTASGSAPNEDANCLL